MATDTTTGGRFTLGAKLMAGVAALGCAVTLTVGGLSAGGTATTRVAGLGGAGHAPAATVAPADPFDPTVCQYPVRLEPICPEALPSAPATQP